MKQGRRGFTLVEILIVIGLLGILMGALVFAVGGISSKSRIRKCEGLFERIGLAMQAYYSDFGDYPPDGFDSTVSDSSGIKIRGSHCLTYFLAQRTGGDGKNEVKLFRHVLQPDFAEEKTRPIRVTPYLKLFNDEIGKGERPEILDPWGNPLHYDYTMGDRVTYQDTVGGKYHMGPTGDMKQTDPRRGRVASKVYDVWSHGLDALESNASAEDDILASEVKH